MNHDASPSEAREGLLAAGDARLYLRDIGKGRPIIVIHGGPDFDHAYLLPEMDRLADGYRLVYYDQRGRGRSTGYERPEQASLACEIGDLDRVRQYVQAGSVALLGHSWGGLLAIEYAIRHPECVSQLILMNTAPASHDDYVRSRRAGNTEALRRVASSTKFVQGDIASDLDYYRLHFRAALQAPEHLEAIVRRLRAHFTAAGIVKARAIEERLVNETWLSRDYDLMPPHRPASRCRAGAARRVRPVPARRRRASRPSATSRAPGGVDGVRPLRLSVKSRRGSPARRRLSRRRLRRRQTSSTQ